MNLNHRPTSPVMSSDLPIYIIPDNFWDGHQNSMLSDIIKNTTSAGFLRVNQEQTLSELRAEIDSQLGYEFIPKDYVFCKCVGKCLSQVREKQESLLKAKHFLPPNSPNPELFVISNDVNKQSRNSSLTTERHKRPSEEELDAGRRIIDNTLYKESSDRISNTSTKDNETRILRSQDAEVMLLGSESGDLDELNDHTEGSFGNFEIDSRRQEIEDLQKEIITRYSELHALEDEHQQQISNWNYEDDRKKEEEKERRRLQEVMELERRNQEERMIAKQKEELRLLEEMLKDKQIVILASEKQLELDRMKREEIQLIKEREMEYLKKRVEENSRLNSSITTKIQQLQQEFKEMERRQHELEEIGNLEREQAEKDLKTAQIEFENLKEIWEKEKHKRDDENSERLLKEKQLRESFLQKQTEHELLMEEERRKMIEKREKALEIARERFEEEQKHWEEERIRYEEDEKKRIEEMTTEIKEAYKNKPAIPTMDKLETEFNVSESSEFNQKNHLKAVFQAAKAEREIEEKIRETTIRKVRAIQLKIQSRRNDLNEMWKKRFLDEKKKTSPLEDLAGKYKEELDAVRRKMLSLMEAGVREENKLSKHPGSMDPSDKANHMLAAYRIQQEMESIQQKIGINQMKLMTERKLREQAETEVKMLRVEVMQNKIRLKRTRTDQVALRLGTRSLECLASPNNKSTTNGSLSNVNSIAS